jgi:hypothetical protein
LVPPMGLDVLKRGRFWPWLSLFRAYCFEGGFRFRRTCCLDPDLLTAGLCEAAPFGLHQARFERELAMRNSRPAYSVDDLAALMVAGLEALRSPHLQAPTAKVATAR